MYRTGRTSGTSLLAAGGSGWFADGASSHHTRRMTDVRQGHAGAASEKVSTTRTSKQRSTKALSSIPGVVAPATDAELAAADAEEW
jgi:hypothetical protein